VIAALGEEGGDGVVLFFGVAGVIHGEAEKFCLFAGGFHQRSESFFAVDYFCLDLVDG
jgi:hypothetical protein